MQFLQAVGNPVKRKPKVVGNVDSGKPSKSSKSKNTCRILIANGVNLDLLGQREAKIYGTFSLADIEEHLFSITPSLAVIAGIKAKIELEFLQTNDEKQFIESFASDYSGFLINAGAWTHMLEGDIHPTADGYQALAYAFVQARGQR